MRSLTLFGLFFIVLVLCGFGTGFLAGYIEDAEGVLSATLLIGILPILLGVGALYWGFRQARRGGEREVSDLDMLFGDMSDPVQRRIISRTAIAGAIHGILLVAIAGGDLAPVAASDGAGGGDGAGWLTIAAYAAFVLTLVWLAVECVLFHNIDEFWARVALGPAALAGAGLFIAVISWMVAEELFAVPEARFWWFYLFYYFLLLALLLGKWQRTRSGRA